MKNRIVQIAYALKDKFTGQVSKITAGYKRMGDAADNTADKMERSHKRMHGGLKGMAGSLAKVRNIWGTLLATVAGGGVARGVKAASEEFDNLAKTADKVGVSTDFLQELQFAGKRTGVAVNAVSVAVQRFSRRLGEAGNGAGVLSKEFDRLGINVRGADGALRSTEAVLRDYADAIAATTDPQEQLRLAFAAFDTEGAALVNTLRNGSSGLDEFAAAARAAGQVVDEELLRKSEAINDRFDELADSITFKFKQVAVGLADLVNRSFAALDIGSGEITKLEVQLQSLINTRDRLQNQIGQRGSQVALQRLDEIERKIWDVTGRLNDLKVAVDGAAGAADSIQATGIARIRQQLAGATVEANALYKETQKLFAEDKEDPLEGLDSTASKLAAAYDEVGKALSAAREAPDSDNTARQVERAATAINQLQASGDVAKQTLADLSNLLRGTLDSNTETEVSIVPTLDENGVRGYADEATQKLQAEFASRQISVPLELDVSAAFEAIDSVERKYKAMAARLRTISPTGRSLEEGRELARELLQRGSQ